MYEVGYSWETTRGNIFTVIKKAQGFLFLHCNKCSLDTEMFPDGEFKISVSSVTPRSAPCGCGGKRMDARQHTLRAKRAAESHGFIFEGWVEGVKPRPKGHIKLYNPRNGNRWETACAEGLERGFGCPVEGYKEKTLKTKGLTLVDFENNLKTKGKLKSHHTLFTKGEDLYLRCEICSEDEFSKVGVGGDGVFKTKRALLRYNLPCRCVKGCKYTKEQKEFRVKRSIEDRGGEFISLGEDKTTVNYVCKEGHYNTTQYNY